jgi:hypothetical protein
VRGPGTSELGAVAEVALLELPLELEPGGTAAQKKATGRKGGRATSRTSQPCPDERPRPGLAWPLRFSVGL